MWEYKFWGATKLIFLEKETRLKFYQWIEATFPPDPSLFGAKLYVVDFIIFKMHNTLSVLRTFLPHGALKVEQNSVHLRPWHLPYRKDYGLRGTSDGDTSSVIFVD